MKSILQSFSYLRNYTTRTMLTGFLTVIVAIFEVVSLFSVLPFLRLIFPKNGEETLVPVEKPDAFTLSSLTDLGDQIGHHFNYWMYNLAVNYTKLEILTYMSILVFITFFLKNVFVYLNKLVEKGIVYNVSMDLRQNIYDKVLQLPMTQFTEQKRGNILTLFSNDITKLETSVLSGFMLLIKEPIMIFFYITSMLLISPKLTLFIFILIPTLGFLIGQISKSLKRTSTEFQDFFGTLLSSLDETMFGAKVIKSFTAERYLHNRFAYANRQLKKIHKRIFVRRMAASPISEALGIGLVMIVLWYGGYLILKGDNTTITGEILIAYLLLFSRLITPIKSLSTQYSLLQDGMASSDRISNFLSSDVEYPVLPKEVHTLEFNDSIEFDQVNFWYPKSEKQILKGLNLSLPKGTVTALVGHSGAGKSTIADLLPRFYDVTDGQILLDNKNINDISLEQLRGIIAYVSQEAILFNDSVRNNICFGMENKTEEEIIQAAKIANAHQFISELEQGYDTNIGDRGTKLSGGQRQRLTIARAILKNAPILILDEATSALDTESERLVQEAIDHLLENRTALVIAHRLSTIKNADNICVVENGQIIEQGSHEQLLKKQHGYYKSMTELQMVN